MLKSFPLVTCVMVGSCRPELARQAVRSFDRQLYPERELLFIDTGRANWFDELAASNVRHLQIPGGLDSAALRRYGCEQARGEIVAYWSSTDWQAPDRLEKQVRPLLEQTADITALQTSEFLDLSTWQFCRCPAKMLRSLFGEFNPGTLVFRRQLWDEIARSTQFSGEDCRAVIECAMRAGAALSVIPGKNVYCVVWQDERAREQTCGTAVELKDWPRCRVAGMSPEDRRFYRSIRPERRASLVREHRADPHIPLVSCIMPTSDRRLFVSTAIDRFLAQDYPARELIVVDDGRDPIADLIPADPRIRYLRPQARMTVGSKRNLACLEARGEFVAHWDDDDWMAPWRLSYQVEALLENEADICGLDHYLYWDPIGDYAFRYVYPENERRWLAGGTVVYRRELWERQRFADVDIGEDNDFIWSAAPAKIVRLEREDFYVATLHAGNTSPKVIEPSRWIPIDPGLIRAVLGSQADEMRNILLEQERRRPAPSRWGPQVRNRQPVSTPTPAAVPARFSDQPVASFAVARAQDLTLIEFAAFNYSVSVPWMRRWEIPFALFQSRLTDTMSVLDCTINPVNFGEWISDLYPHVLYRYWNPISDGRFGPPSAVPDGSFDRVCCINTLEHLLHPQREELIASLAAKLKPGGWLITTVDYYFDFARSHPEWLGTGLVCSDGREVFNGFNKVTPGELAELCRRHGLFPTGPVPEDPAETDDTLYLNPPPLIHGSFGGVFCKDRLIEQEPRRIVLSLLTWNTREISLESVAAHVREARMLRRVGHEPFICVVDNGSTDGTAEELRRLDSEIDIPHRFMLNPENRGNSRARNQIIAFMLECGADYVLFTDGDIEIVPFSSMVMLRYLESCGGRVGCLGAYSWDCTPHRDHATPVLFSLAGCSCQASDVLAWTQYGMFRRCMFEDGIRLEEGGPFGGPGHGLEDVDLAFQMTQKGYLNHYFSGMSYLHRQLSSSVPILSEQGLDPTGRYYERKEFLLRKWEGVSGIADGPLLWIRSARAPWIENRAGRNGTVRFAPSTPEIVVPGEVLHWVDRSVSDMMDRTELVALAAALASFPWTGKELVVEIGAYIGTTTVMMAKVLEILGHRPTVLSIDPFERCRPDNLNPQGSYSRYIQNILAQGLADRCIAMAAFSADAAPAVPERIGVLVVDGWHYYDAVRADLELYVPKVVPGGYIFIDDYGPAYPDVVRAVDEFLACNPKLEILAKEYYVVLRQPLEAIA